MRLLYILLLGVLMSCNDKKKEESADVPQHSEEEEKLTLKEEIDDEIIEADVAINRNLTKSFLDFEKANLNGFIETYQHEEPYSIVFLNGNNFVTFQAAEFKTSEIEANINLFVHVSNITLEIKKTMINGFDLSFVEYEYNERKWVHSVINIDETDQRILMQISSEQALNTKELMEKYLIVKRKKK